MIGNCNCDEGQVQGGRIEGWEGEKEREKDLLNKQLVFSVQIRDLHFISEKIILARKTRLYDKCFAFLR